jgi:hypothetical protein
MGDIDLGTGRVTTRQCVALNGPGVPHMKKKGRIGSSFDDFLEQEGIYEEVTARAIKRVIAGQLDALMEDQGFLFHFPISQN